MAQSTLLEAIKEPGYYNPQVEGLFSVQTQKAQNGKAPRRARVIPYQFIHDSVAHGHINYCHELFVGVVKPVFDIDFPRDVRNFDDNRFINRLIGHLSERCGYSSDHTDWCVMQCLYPDKLSLHLVLNSHQHYKSLEHQKAHLIASGVDFQEYFIDTQIYKQTSTLRTLGMSKWDESEPRPFLLKGFPNIEITYRKVTDCMAQHITVGSREIVVEGASQNIRRFDARPREDPTSDIGMILAGLRNNPRAGDLQATVINKIDDMHISFDVDDCCVCDHNDGRIIANISRKTAKFSCGLRICADQHFGYTPRSIQYLEQEKHLMFLEKHGVCRLDWPIYDSVDPDLRSIGFFDMSMIDLYDRLRAKTSNNPLIPCNCAFCEGDGNPASHTFFYVPISGSLIDEEFFVFLRDRHGFFEEDDKSVLDILIGYLGLFLCTVKKTDSWYYRTRSGLLDIKKGSIEREICGKLIYPKVKITGRGKNKVETIVWKPFFSFFEKSGRYEFASVNNGVLNPFDPKCVTLTPPKGINSPSAMMEFLNLPEPDRLCLRRLWEDYLRMATFYEQEQESTRTKVSDFLERWTLQILFETLRSMQVMVLLMSSGGGQGKSTLGKILMKALGSGFSSTRSVAHILGGRFNYNTNHFIFFDEITLTKESSEILKEAITADVLTIEKKGLTPYTDVCHRNFLGSSNRPVCLAVNSNGAERRICVLKFLDVASYNEVNLFDYHCDCLHNRGERDDFGELVMCQHSYIDHTSFIERFYSLVLGVAEERGPLFISFIGMLYGDYLQKRGTWTSGIAQSMVLSKATAEVQEMGDTLTSKFIDHCNERKFHWSSSHGPDKLQTVVEHRAEDVVRLDNNAPPKWEKFVTISALYQCFFDWCRGNNSPVPQRAYFLEDLHTISVSRRGVSMKQQILAKAQKLKWTTQMGSDRPMWINLGNPEYDVPCLDMGEGPWVRARVGDLVPGANRHVIIRSASSAGVLSNSFSQSDNSNPPVVPRKRLRETDENTRQVVEKGVNLRDILRRVRAYDDANDGFGQMNLDEEEHESSDLMDERAEKRDTLMLRKMKNIPKFLDGEAEEDSDEEEEEQAEELN
jgi:hypothetical protein